MRTHLITPKWGLRFLAAAISFFALTSIRAADLSGNQGRFLESDYQFAVAAARGGAMEVTLGKMAVLKSTDEGVKQFGDRVAKDHVRGGRDLEALVTRKGAVVSTQPTLQQQKDMDALNSLNGREFDQAYMHMMVQNHQADLKAFKRAVKTAEDSDLKTFAGNMVPIIEEHLKMAQDLENNMNTTVSVNP